MGYALLPAKSVQFGPILIVGQHFDAALQYPHESSAAIVSGTEIELRT